LRASLAQAIRGALDLKLVGEADDLPEGLRLLDAVQPEVLLVDIGLPSGSGLELIRHAAKQSPHCNIMVITVFAEEEVVLDCIEAGATGYLLKGSSPQDIAAQIRSLPWPAAARSSPTIARRLLRRFTGQRNAEAQAPVYRPRSRPCCRMSAKGYSYDEIARLLSVAGTPSRPTSNVSIASWQVHSKTAAVLRGTQNWGLVDD